MSPSKKPVRKKSTPKKTSAKKIKKIVKSPTDLKKIIPLAEMDTTAQTIMDRLRPALSPTRFSLKNESHLHKKHKGNTGGGHYNLYIVSDSFEGLNALQRNRWVMRLLEDLFPKKIHALSLSLKTEAEAPFLQEEVAVVPYGRKRGSFSKTNSNK